MTIQRVLAGNVVESTVTFTPESGTVALADVTARLRKHDGTEVVLTTAVAGVSSGISGAHPTFEVEWTSEDDDPTGVYRIRWESNLPSPKIVFEDVVHIIGSTFAAP